MARATSRSYIRWRFSQNSGVIPSALPIRNAVSAVIDLRQWTISCIRTWGTPIVFAKRYWVMPSSLMTFCQVFSWMYRSRGGHSLSIVAQPDANYAWSSGIRTQLAPAAFSTCYPCNISLTRRENIMLTKPSKTADEDLPQGRMLTEEEDREMKENLARRNFGMSLDEFTEAWKASKFDGDREKHGDVVFLASMLPEYWTD